MPLSRAEFLLRRRFPRRSTILLIDAACLLGWTTVKEIAELAQVSRRRAELELAELVRDGWLAREERGPKNQARQVRFIARVAAIAGDRTGTIVDDRTAAIVDDRSPGLAPTRRTQARDHAQQKPDLSLDPGSMEQRVRPSGGVQGGEPAADGRTDGGDKLAEHRNALTERVCREWARWGVTESVAYRGIDRLLNARLTERELQKFLVDALKGAHPAFVGVQEHMRWGHSTSAERIALWLRDERRPLRRGPSLREQLERELEPTMPAPDEMTAIAELVKARMK